MSSIREMERDAMRTGRLGLVGGLLAVALIIGCGAIFKGRTKAIVRSDYLRQTETASTPDGVELPGDWVNDIGVPSSSVTFSFDVDVAVGTSNPRNVQAVNDIFQRAADFEGKRMTLRGTVTEVLSQRAFILQRDVMVVNVSEFVPAYQALRGQTAVVEGVVTPLAAAELQDISGMPSQDVLAHFQGKHILVVDKSEYGSQL